MIKMVEKLESFKSLEKASVAGDGVAQWLRECPAEYHLIFSTIPQVRDVDKLRGMLSHWALRQGKLLKSQLAYRGVVTDAGASKRVHIHALVHGTNHQGITLRKNHRSPIWFHEYNARKLWPGSVKAVEVIDLEALITYITIRNYSDNLFVPIFGQTSKKLLEV
jgi:hypothetical protein